MNVRNCEVPHSGAFASPHSHLSWAQKLTSGIPELFFSNHKLFPEKQLPLKKKQYTSKDEEIISWSGKLFDFCDRMIFIV